MTAKTHNAFAFASLVTVAAAFPPENLNLITLFTSVIAVSIGALIPDMDQAGNNLWDLFPGGSGFGRFMRRIFYKHRTLTHSLLGTFIIYKLLDLILHKIVNPDFLNPDILLGSIMVGYLSHLLSDSLTEEGLPLLFPFKITFGIPPIRAVRIKTGKWFENFVVLPAVWIYAFYIINLKKEMFLNLIKNITG